MHQVQPIRKHINKRIHLKNLSHSSIDISNEKRGEKKRVPIGFLN